MQKGQWARAGFVFGLASVVMLILTVDQLIGYYVTDVGEDDDTSTTLREVCQLWEEEEGAIDLDSAIWCEPEQQENYQFIWQLLISVGLTMICVGKSKKSTNRPNQQHQQPVVQQRFQQPPQY
jgi:hypothetical protein